MGAPCRSCRQRGQALPEMVIVFPLAVVLIMCIVQLGLLYRARATLNNATFLAARSGALHHGFLGPMQQVFYDRMAALGKIEETRKNQTTTAGFFADPDATRFARVRAETRRHHTYRALEIMFPTKAVFDHFAVRHRELEACATSPCDNGGGFRLAQRSIYQIPNNNLDARDATPQTIGERRITLQDANLLSIRSRFCYEMAVPVANFIISRMFNSLYQGDADLAVCRGLSDASNVIPLTGHAIIRMQSAFRCQGDEEGGNHCENI